MRPTAEQIAKEMADNPGLGELQAARQLMAMRNRTYRTGRDRFGMYS